MRHVFHTCLLAFRLIASVNSWSHKDRPFDIFGDEVLNKTFACFYMDPGVETRRSFYAVTAFNDQQLQA